MLVREWEQHGSDATAAFIASFVDDAFAEASIGLCAKLSAAETVLQKMLTVPAELAGTGRTDIADFYICTYHKVLSSKLVAEALSTIDRS